MQFFQQQLLQFLGSVPLGRFDARLCQQPRGVDPRLRQQTAEVDILRLKRVVVADRKVDGHAPFSIALRA
ncbi:MAG TPA: hypothetical protein VIJ17_02765 [Pseudolabrys sp.]